MESIEKERETIGATLRETKEILSEKGKKLAMQVGESCSDRIDDVMSSTGDKLSSLANTMKDSVPTNGKLRSALTTVADGIESSGTYLSEHGVNDVSKDISGLVKRYPLRSILVGLGIGVVAGRIMKSGRA